MNNDIKQKIIEFNNQFGIKTEFVTHEDVLGYALGDTIYINENIEQDYEKTNKHELLHFFEDREEFQVIKRRLLGEHADKLDEIRSEYELRYFGLYSEEEIRAGVLDNEIVIDMMVDNSSLEYADGLKIGEDFFGQIQHGIEEKRYLNLTLKANIKSMNLSNWEKIFVLNYYDGKERKLPQKDKINGIKSDIEKYLEQLYELDETQMKINPHSPEVIREYESEIKALKARGEDTSYLEASPERGYQEISEKMSKQLYAEYKHIVDLIKGLDYEPAFKCMMLRETLTKVYKLDKDSEKTKTIVKSRKLDESIAGHMILNESTLKCIYENIEQYKNFANLYFAAVEVYKKTIAQKSGISLEGVNTYEKGKWLKFDGKETDEENYLENAERLAALVKDTPWCTKTLASTQLAEGDFYVFVDNEEKPHIAVKLSGDEIDEVRGIQNGNAQELEEEYRDVAISFLHNNRNIKNGKEWLEKEEWNKRLIEYNRKIDNGEFTVDDVPSFMEDYLKPDYKSHEGEINTNIIEFGKKLSKIKGILAQYYKCEESEICIGDVTFGEFSEVNPYKIIFGSVSFQYYAYNEDFGEYLDEYNSIMTNLGNLQIIAENVYFGYSAVEDLGNLQTIGGNADFRGLDIKNLGNLQTIGGDAWFWDSEITDLGNLQTIGGDAEFSDSKIKSLGNLQTIGGDAWFWDSEITDFGDLQYIGGEMKASDALYDDLEYHFELIKRRRLTGQDIGQAGFEVGIDVCDNADNFVKEQLRTEEKGDEVADEQL